MLLIGGPIELYVDGSTMEAGQSVDSDATTLIFWEGRQRPKKITVETSAPGQVYGLTTELVFVLGEGMPQGTVDLVDGMFPQDYVRNIRNKKEGFGLIRYTARVAPGQGAGEDVHTVIYTLTDQ
jgi:hypothetical protein